MDSATREDLKRNELGEAVEGAIHYAEDHLKTILRIAAGIVGAGILAAGIFFWSASRSRAANELLVRGLKTYDAPIVASGALPDDPSNPTFADEAARRTRAKAIFSELDDRFGGRATGRIAKLYLAQIAMAENQTDQARSLWQKFLEAEPTGSLAATARVNLWKIDRAAGRSEEVAKEISALLDAADKPLPGDVLLYQLAVTYQALGRNGDAAAAFRRLVDEHPQSPYFAEAQRSAGPAPKES
ncbi:MAG: tol-pal system YbgF family protein [Thermoanaerobaculia bacterium]